MSSVGYRDILFDNILYIGIDNKLITGHIPRYNMKRPYYNCNISFNSRRETGVKKKN